LIEIKTARFLLLLTTVRPIGLAGFAGQRSLASTLCRVFLSVRMLSGQANRENFKTMLFIS